MILLTLFAILTIAYSVVGGIFYLSTPPNRRMNLPLRKYTWILGLAILVVSNCIVKIGPQDVGVLVTPKYGVIDEELHTGWHIVLPWNDVHQMDKTVWVYTCADATKEGAKPNADAIWAPTKDGIKMGSDVSVSWRIIPDEASWIYANVTENDGGKSGRYIWLEENMIRAKLKSVLALTVSDYTPIEVYSVKRQEIQDRVLKKLQEECQYWKIIIQQVDIREVYYNKEYEASINAKKLAEQEALRLVEVTKQKNELLKQASINKDIAIQQAEGEAKALQIKGSAIVQNPKIIDLEWINKWDGSLPQYMLGGGEKMMLNINK